MATIIPFPADMNAAYRRRSRARLVPVYHNLHAEGMDDSVPLTQVTTQTAGYGDKGNSRERIQAYVLPIEKENRVQREEEVEKIVPAQAVHREATVYTENPNQKLQAGDALKWAKPTKPTFYKISNDGKQVKITEPGTYEVKFMALIKGKADLILEVDGKKVEEKKMKAGGVFGLDVVAKYDFADMTTTVTVTDSPVTVRISNMGLKAVRFASEPPRLVIESSQ